jgi:hypothetical protein
VSLLYERYGPAPHTYAAMVGRDLEDKGANYDRAIRTTIASHHYDELAKISESAKISSPVWSRVALVEPESTGSHRFAFSVVTSYVQGILVDSLRERHWDYICQRLMLSDILYFYSPLGWVWEGYCHRQIPTISQLDVTDFETGEAVTLKGLPTNVIRVKEARLVTLGACYYMPAVRDQAKFDAFSITQAGEVVTFQYTTFWEEHWLTDRADRCDYITKKLDSVAVALGKESDLLPWKAGGTWHHVLVMPEGDSEVKRKDMVKTLLMQDSGNRRWTSHVKRYVCRLRVE